jgi:hypothetical protein
MIIMDICQHNSLQCLYYKIQSLRSIFDRIISVGILRYIKNFVSKAIGKYNVVNFPTCFCYGNICLSCMNTKETNIL